MMRPVRYYITVSALIVTLFGCRPTGDDLISYGQNDNQAYGEVHKSHAATFKALWMAMNENYCIWDYESAHGVDWDEVYADYLPLFEALDDSTRRKPVTMNELKALYAHFLDSLHDGHLGIQISSSVSPETLSFQPGVARVKRERGGEYAVTGKYLTNPSRYTATDTEFHIEQLDSANGPAVAMQYVMEQCDTIILRSEAFLAELEPLRNTEAVEATYQLVAEMKRQAESIRFMPAPNASCVPLYNSLCTQYKAVGQLIGMTLKPVSTSVYQDMMRYLYTARFEGNILYLRLGAFGLTNHLSPSAQPANPPSDYAVYRHMVDSVWHRWFDSIKRYHDEGTLGGVIIDVRNNNGGYVNDYQYVLGALLPSGGVSPCKMRMKNGVGRYDFAPVVSFTLPTYPNAHAVITDEPIVVLSNVRSISMAEQTAWGVKTLPNGTLIGTRTFGALSALNTDPAYYSQTYSGAFGEKGVTPVYGYVPKYVAMYDVKGDGELQILEGIGITPDIEVPFDLPLYLSTGRDNQLEAALRYIKKR